jgi:hypothetical protein
VIGVARPDPRSTPRLLRKLLRSGQALAAQKQLAHDDKTSRPTTAPQVRVDISTGTGETSGSPNEPPLV